MRRPAKSLDGFALFAWRAALLVTLWPLLAYAASDAWGPGQLLEMLTEWVDDARSYLIPTAPRSAP